MSNKIINDIKLKFLKFKKNNFLKEKYLLIFSILWLFVGINLAFGNYRQIWSLTNIIDKTQYEKNIILYGNDFEAYRYLETTPRDSKILFLVPRGYYLPKSVFFLYPRKIYAIKGTNELLRENLKNHNYLLIFYAGDDYDGYVPDFNYFIKNYWNLDILFNYHKQLTEEKDNFSFEDYTNFIKTNKGILLYTLDNLE